MNGYDLSRTWFDFAFENPEKISPNHAAIYFFAIEHNNRLGWRNKFGFPTQMAMDAIGIKKASTYKKYFDDLVEWGFFVLIQESKNQYSANIISLNAPDSAKPKNGKALDKAIVKHAAKQTEGTGLGMGQSKRPIDKPLTIEPINHLTNKQEQISSASILGSQVMFSMVEMALDSFFKNNVIPKEFQPDFFDEWRAANFDKRFDDITHVRNSLKLMAETKGKLIKQANGRSKQNGQPKFTEALAQWGAANDPRWKDR